jgi:hypothetical protein
MRPRPYLSHSSKVLWKKSPKQWIEKYLFDKAKFETKEMRFGTMMATALEDDDLTGDPLLDTVIMDIPKFEIRDKPMEGVLVIGKEKIPLLVRMDTTKEDLSAFKEYKSGKGVWTQAKVDQDPQITFYATYCYIMKKRIPEDIELVWIPTMDELDEDGQKTGRIIATGEIVRFPTRRSLEQIITEMADIRKVWNEIGEACEKELL